MWAASSGNREVATLSPSSCITLLSQVFAGTDVEVILI